MAKRSAGILLFRQRDELEVFLVHPGGPLWAKKDAGTWTIPKGEFEDDEDPLAAARREFVEETGFSPEGEFHDMKEIRQAGGKRVRAWAVEGDYDAANLSSNTFSMEWPPRSGKIREFPEVDRGCWFSIADAVEKMNPAQAAWLVELVDWLATNRER